MSEYGLVLAVNVTDCFFDMALLPIEKARANLMTPRGDEAGSSTKSTEASGSNGWLWPVGAMWCRPESAMND